MPSRRTTVASRPDVQKEANIQLSVRVDGFSLHFHCVCRLGIMIWKDTNSFVFTKKDEMCVDSKVVNFWKKREKSHVTAILRKLPRRRDARVFEIAILAWNTLVGDKCFQLQIRRFLGFRFLPEEFDLPLFSFQFLKFHARLFDFCRRATKLTELSTLRHIFGNVLRHFLNHFPLLE